jgi:sarcosine oxidase
MHTYLPGAIGPALQTKTCLYTLTPDRDFVLDRLPGHPGVVVALGAAHAYKFAALFGKELAALALDPSRRAPDPRLALFAAGRPGLRTHGTTNFVGTTEEAARIALQ